MTSELRLKLKGVLTAAFDTKDLLQLATLRLAFENVRIAKEVNFAQSNANVAFDLVKTVEHHGHLEPLLLALQLERGDRPDVAELLAAFEWSEAVAPSLGKVPPNVRVAVIEFRTRFQERRKQFDYLSAYKQLHDLLHGLKRFRGDLESMVAKARRSTEGTTDPDGIIDPIEDLLREGRQGLKEIEFPDSPPKWFAGFEAAVEELIAEVRKPDPLTIDDAKLDRALVVLAQFPAQQQTELNTRLVECAMRLRTDDLVKDVDDVLMDLNTARASGPESEELRAGLGPFRGPCLGLTLPIKNHNLCQKINEALQEAAGLPQVAPGLLAQWSDVKESLKSIAESDPNDLHASRSVESARRFEEAARTGDEERTATALKGLLVRFDKLLTVLSNRQKIVENDARPSRRGPGA